jgi:hypothetical protein
MAEEQETKVGGDEEKRIKRKQSLEASVTLGLGYGQKKKQHVKAFFGAVWPVLQTAGWTLVSFIIQGRGLAHGVWIRLQDPLEIARYISVMECKHKS